MFNLKLTGRTFHGEARVHASGTEGASIRINQEQVWTASELRQVAAMLESAARIMEAA